MTTGACISLGSNVAADANLRAALKALRDRFGAWVASHIYETPAVGFEGDSFLNLVVALPLKGTVEDALQALRDIEAAQGRHRGEQKFAPRTIDLDLLTWGDLVEGRLPRADIVEYDFVLGPLAEVAGDELHPVLKRSYRTLWQEMQAQGAALARVDEARERAILAA